MEIVRFINGHRKSLSTLIISATFGLGLMLTPLASAITIGGPSNCDNNAIINCGAHSTAALKQAYDSSAYVQKVYAYYGIGSADIANLDSTNVSGRVTIDGKVFIDGQSRAVATDAVTGGRQDIAGSTQVNFEGITFFKRPPSVSFLQNSLPAFVSMKNGVFQFAILASCGNAVRATATTEVKAAIAPAKVVSTPPTPAPAPSQVQAQSQNQIVSQNQQVNITNSTTPETTPAPSPSASVESQPASEQASSLVNTGPSGVVGVFLASSFLGVLGYRKLLLHKLITH